MSEEIMKQESADRPPQNRRWPKALLKFGAVFAAVCAMTMGMLYALAFAAFRLRLSTQVIRLGITGLYILPCLIGGRILRALRFAPPSLWGACIGAVLYLSLFAVSWFASGMPSAVTIGFEIPLLCIAGGAVGGLVGRKKARKSKSDKSA